jgi:hypothetical protein
MFRERSEQKEGTHRKRDVALVLKGLLLHHAPLHALFSAKREKERGVRLVRKLNER